MKKIFLQFTMIIAMIILPFMTTLAQNAWINEFHYDNAGTDVGEFIEVVVENAGTYTLSDFRLDLYNGAVGQGTSYNNKTLDLFTVGTTSGNYTFYSYTYPVDGFQNGAPDGIALSYQGTLITGQFLSYEGTFTGVGGVAAGVLSTDVGQSESSSTPVGYSIQLAGSGTIYSNFTWQAPAIATKDAINTNQSFGGVVLPSIVKAYAISTTAVDVLYNLDVTAVDPGDYNMSGSASTVFSGAAIDGTNAKLVHLTGANPVMAADITLDNLYDDANSSNIDFYAGIMPFTFTNSNNPAGVMDNIHLATFKGIVSANDAFNNVWVSDAAGQYHGVLIFSTSFQALVAVEDQILFTATRTVFNGQTELQNPSLISIISTGNTPYGPSVINGSDISETLAVNTNPAEPWESQLTKIQNFTVLSYDATNFDYRCSWVSGANTYYFHIGDNVDFHFTTTSAYLIVGQSYQSITGVIDWLNTTPPGPFYRINPRTPADIVINVVNPATKLAITSVNGGVDPYENLNFSITVQSQDASGNPAAVTSTVNFNLTTNGGSGGTVAFAPGSTTSGAILIGTNEIILTGVKMALAGTNVTITASPTPPGLTPGTSAPFNVLAYTLPQIIISEILQDPVTVTDANGEWFEVFNNGNAAVDMNGWIIKDDGTDTHTITSSLIVPSKGFSVLGIKADPLINGDYTCNYQYATFTLANADDEVVLLLPDGVTEIDRVNYTGIAPWVDPSGASMIFTGTPTDDNNDPAFWAAATLREPSFNGATGDFGSPGTNGTGQQLTGSAGFSLNLKVFLEGPYNPTTNVMSTDLLTNNLIPLGQPFNPALPYYGNNTPKWLYSGTQSVTSFPAGTVDYVLIELRDAASAALATSATRIAQVPALLRSDGSIVSLDGTSLPSFTNAVNNFLYIIVWSRNHVGIMSSGNITPGGTVVWDFTTGAGQFYGTSAGYKEIETGVWGMAAGDINADGNVDATDKSPLGWKVDAGKNGYLGADLNMNTQVSNKDKNDFWVPNNNIKSTQVPN
jgi:hypothetical protein